MDNIMSVLKFEGFVTGLRLRQLEFIEKVLINLGYSDSTVKVEKIGKAGDNMMAEVRRFVVEKDEKQFSIVGKIAPESEHTRAALFTHEIFLNEHLMYNVILPKFSELEEGAIIPVTDRFKYAKFYGSLMEEPDEVILLEDLQAEGFIMLDKTKALPDKAIILALKHFASYHSLSYIWKTLEPETYMNQTSRLTNKWTHIPLVLKMQKVFSSIQQETMKLNILKNEKHRKCLKYLKDNFQDLTKKVVKKEQTYITIHGDAWNNNVLFHMEDEPASSGDSGDESGSEPESPTEKLLQQNHRQQEWMENHNRDNGSREPQADPTASTSSTTQEADSSKSSSQPSLQKILPKLEMPGGAMLYPSVLGLDGLGSNLGLGNLAMGYPHGFILGLANQGQDGASSSSQPQFITIPLSMAAMAAAGAPSGSNGCPGASSDDSSELQDLSTGARK